MELAQVSDSSKNQVDGNSPFEGNLRANGQYKIEKMLQVPEVKQLVTTLSNITERAGPTTLTLRRVKFFSSE